MTSIAPPATPAQRPTEPLLEAGDRLTRDEFERRYHRMPNVKKAELIEGIVYMPSPVRLNHHAHQHAQLATWLGTYESETCNVISGDNATVRLDLDNEPQPDLVLMLRPERGGASRISEDDYIEGGPEFVAEVAASSASYDLHQKKGAYRRNGIREYLVWIIAEERVVWFGLRDGDYAELAPDADGLLRSGVFPGLWLNASALLRGDMKAVLAAVRRGCESAEHTDFIK